MSNRRVFVRSVEQQEGGGVGREPGEITITLETSCVDPSDVTVGEILDAVKRQLMVWEPEGVEDD